MIGLIGAWLDLLAVITLAAAALAAVPAYRHRAELGRWYSRRRMRAIKKEALEMRSKRRRAFNDDYRPSRVDHVLTGTSYLTTNMRTW